MAKKAETAEANGEDAPKRGRAIMIKDPDTGEEIRRVDFIRREVMERGRTRSEVAKQLTEIQGQTVPYQIVFAATKDLKIRGQGEGEGEAAAE